MTNKEKFIEAFGYDGSIVSDVLPYYICARRISGSCGYDKCTESCGSRSFPRCPHWWNDEYKEEKNVSS